MSHSTHTSQDIYARNADVITHENLRSAPPCELGLDLILNAQLTIALVISLPAPIP